MEYISHRNEAKTDPKRFIVLFYRKQDLKIYLRIFCQTLNQRVVGSNADKGTAWHLWYLKIPSSGSHNKQNYLRHPWPQTSSERDSIVDVGDFIQVLARHIKAMFTSHELRWGSSYRILLTRSWRFKFPTKTWMTSPTSVIESLTKSRSVQVKIRT
jgi:hypothetical protein